MLQVSKTVFLPILSFLICIIITAVLMLVPFEHVTGPWLYYDLPLVTIGLLIIIGSIPLMIRTNAIACHMIDLGQLILVTSFFGLALTLLIHQQLHSRWVVWGLFQINDAADFLNSAVTYLFEGSFFTPRGRVISNLLYAGLIDLTNFNLRLSMWVITFIAILSTVILLAVLSRCMSTVVALIATFVLLQFAYEHIGGTTTELPGLSFGLSATALLVFGAHSGSRSAVLVGYTILCVAMITRIGAALVLPGILIWSFYYLPPLLNRRWLMGAVGLIITGVVIIGNTALTKQISPQSGGSFVNAVDSWYAVIVEGQLLLGQRTKDSVITVTRWVQIYRDYPDILALPKTERPKRKKEIFSNTLKTAPEAAVVGSLKEIIHYFSDFLMYRFVEIKPVRIFLTLLTIIGGFNLLIIMRRKQNPVGGLLGISFIALVLSQPFLYGGESRVPAPTVGFLAAITGHGWVICSATLRQRIRKFKYPRTLLSEEATSMYAWFAVLPTLLLCIIVLVGINAGGSWRTKDLLSIDRGICASGKIPTVVVTGKGSSIMIGGNNGYSYGELKSRGKWIDNRLRSDVNSYLPLLPAVSAIVAPSMIGYGFDMVKGNLLSPLVHQSFEHSQLVSACARIKEGVWWLSSTRKPLVVE